MTPRQKLLPAILCSIIFCESCVKDPAILPPPVRFPIESIEQTPFKTFIDSLQGLGNSVLLQIETASLVNPFYPHTNVPGQAVIGYSFRSSVAGKVTSLGIFLPGEGYSHTVNLWDSLTHQILAQADVPSIQSGKFTYVNLAAVNEAVDIQPNYPYIVTFNSLAIGSALNTSSSGNNVYYLSGIHDLLHEGNILAPIIPFTQGTITFEAYYYQPYNSILILPSPAQIQSKTDNPFLFGVCDIGFIPN